MAIGSILLGVGPCSTQADPAILRGRDPTGRGKWYVVSFVVRNIQELMPQADFAMKDVLVPFPLKEIGPRSTTP